MYVLEFQSEIGVPSQREESERPTSERTYGELACMAGLLAFSELRVFSSGLFRSLFSRQLFIAAPFRPANDDGAKVCARIS